MNFSINHDKPRKFMKVFVSSHICGSHICTHTAVSVPKNHDFSNVFEIGSNDHKMSYKLCRSVLGVQRDNFRPPIIFSATFGQMVGHILRSRKSQNSPKNRFLSKIQISIRWPILAGMMKYGRKCAPEVFAPRFDILSHLD